MLQGSSIPVHGMRNAFSLLIQHTAHVDIAATGVTQYNRHVYRGEKDRQIVIFGLKCSTDGLDVKWQLELISYGFTVSENV